MQLKSKNIKPETMPKVKQILVIRKDLKMRRGKEISQGSHAAMDFLVERIRKSILIGNKGQVSFSLNETETLWISGGMAKVCLQVETEDELQQVHRRALVAGLESHLITDSGRTEFNGVPTVTACAVGPAEENDLEPITGMLKLY